MPKFRKKGAAAVTPAAAPVRKRGASRSSVEIVHGLLDSVDRTLTKITKYSTAWPAHASALAAVDQKDVTAGIDDFIDARTNFKNALAQMQNQIGGLETLAFAPVPARGAAATPLAVGDERKLVPRAIKTLGAFALVGTVEVMAIDGTRAEVEGKRADGKLATVIVRRNWLARLKA
jgi:hypothetical protein